MKTLCFLLIPVLCAGADAPSSVDSLIQQARVLPAEFAADAMLRLAGVESLEKPRRIELLQQAFDRAAGAQQPLKRRATPFRLEGPAGFLNRAYAQELDTLSLRLRAVDGLLPLDEAKARELFSKIPPLALKPATCDDFMVYDVAPFYDVLSRIARHDDRAARLLERYTGSVTSAAQVGPAARLLAESGLKDEEFRTLVAGYSKALSKIKGDDRTFTQYRAAGRQVLALSQELQRRKMPPTSLLEAYRLYLVNNLSGVRCADGELMQGMAQSFGLLSGGLVDREAANLVDFFNDSLRLPPLEPIEIGEMTPEKLSGAAIGLRWCEDAACRDIADKLFGLTFAPNRHPYLPADKNQPEWQEKLQKALEALAQWKPEPGDAARQFRERTGGYIEVLGVATTGADREKVLRGLLQFVAKNEFQAESRMDWFLAVNGLIGRVALDPVGHGSFAEELRKSEDPTIALYARLEQVAPRTPASIMPLL
jgi:hypothetical protein